MVMPLQKPGRSKQDYTTPDDFLAAAKSRLGITEFAIDLAADETNTVAEHWFDKEQDSLKQPWSLYTSEPGLWGWLNMEFGDIDPWVEKCWFEAQKGAKTAALVPAGVGSNWWKDWVHLKCQVLLLNGRLCFIKDWATTIDPATLKPGKGPARCYSSRPLYPKDCCLLLYGAVFAPRYDVWTWSLQLTSAAESGGSSRRAGRARR